MDGYWLAVAKFLEDANAAAGGVVAPVQFAAEFGYGDTVLPAASRAKTLVLHKGLYRDLDPAFVEQALEKMRPVFANEVFIVLSENSRTLPWRSRRHCRLDAVRAWLKNPQKTAAPPAAPRPRMAPVYLGNNSVLVETLHRHLMVLPADDRAITPHMIRDGYFDLHVTQFIARTLKPGMIYVDVGANIGVYALLAAGLVGAKGRVVTIEALPRLDAYLRDNFAMNGFLDRTTRLPFAAADKTGEMIIHDFDIFNGGSTLLPEAARLGEELFGAIPAKITVPVRPLSSLLEQAGIARADLIKIDVEGFELEVLRGARAFLAAQAQCSFLIEWHTSFMTRERQSELYRLLTGEWHGRIEIIGENGATRAAGLEELQNLEHADLFVKCDRAS